VFDLIRAGACDRLAPRIGGFDARRESLWQELGRMAYDEQALPLVLDGLDADVDLAELSAREAMGWEYELTGFSTRGQLMLGYRPALRRAGVLTAANAKRKRPGARVRVAGMNILVQQPRRAKGVTFVTLEDETGLIDLTLWPDTYARFRDVVRNEHLILAEGVLQDDHGAITILATNVVSCYREYNPPGSTLGCSLPSHNSRHR
jgi:error-prone DNA polymerase